MGVPVFKDCLENEIEVDDAEASGLICKLDHARTEAAYWRGYAEGLKEGLIDGETKTIAYLKDRLARAEVFSANRPPSPLPEP